MGKKFPRKIFFIDRKFQVSFILKFLLLLVVGTLLFDIAAYLILDKRIEGTFYSAHLDLQSLREMLLPSILSLSFIFIILLGAAILVMTLLVSHLIAGPLYAIRRYIENIGEGNLDFVARLRSKDQTTPLAESLAQSLEVLNEKLSAIQAHGAEVEVEAQRLTEILNGQSPDLENARVVSARIAGLGAELQKEAGFFTTRSSDTKD